VEGQKAAGKGKIKGHPRPTSEGKKKTGKID